MKWLVGLAFVLCLMVPSYAADGDKVECGDYYISFTFIKDERKGVFTINKARINHVIENPEGKDRYVVNVGDIDPLSVSENSYKRVKKCLINH